MFGFHGVPVTLGYFDVKSLNRGFYEILERRNSVLNVDV